MPIHQQHKKSDITQKSLLLQKLQEKLASIPRETRNKLNELEKEREKIMFLFNPETVEKKTLASREIRKGIEQKIIEDRPRKAEESRLREEAQLREFERLSGDGKRRRKAVRKPLSIKNPNENDPSVNLYPQYDFSKYDAQIKKRR